MRYITQFFDAFTDLYKKRGVLGCEFSDFRNPIFNFLLCHSSPKKKEQGLF